MYPTWHALFRNIPEDTVTKLASHHVIDHYGLRSGLGYIVADDGKITMTYMDAAALEMYQLDLLEGRLPEREDEIVVSRGILEALALSGEIGDTIRVPYQVNRNESLDFIQEKNFVICGFCADTEAMEEQKSYTSFVSKNTEKMEESIKQLAEEFGIAEQDYRINDDYLWANYVDPSFVPVIVIILLIIIMAGMITIYSSV